MMTFPEKLKYVREKVFLSQTDLAKELGVAFATVNRWETGKCKPNIKAKKALHDFCKKNNLIIDDLK
jgi:DNA-binding XRE family transcriptional regulator